MGEHFQRIEHFLLGVPGATLEGVRAIHSHAVALGQVRALIRELGAAAVIEADTAGSAELVAGWGDPSRAAVASRLAADLHGLAVLRANVEDEAHNTTRFYLAAREAVHPRAAVRPGHDHLRVPRAQRAGRPLQGARRLRDQRREHDASRELHAGRRVHRHALPVRRGRRSRATRPSARALDELRFFSGEFRILGTYERDPFRDR